VQVRHHDAHAATFFVSPFEEATISGDGTDTARNAQSAYTGAGNRVERVAQSHIFDSLACSTPPSPNISDSNISKKNGDGARRDRDKTYAKKLPRLIRVAPVENFPSTGFHRLPHACLNQPFTSDSSMPLVRDARRRAAHRNHRDLAFALQHTVRETILHCRVRALSKRHKSRNLCVRGVARTASPMPDPSATRTTTPFGAALRLRHPVPRSAGHCGTTPDSGEATQLSANHTPYTLATAKRRFRAPSVIGLAHERLTEPS
jgi:hypothetical protein